MQQKTHFFGSHRCERLEPLVTEEITGTNPAHEFPVRAIGREGDVGAITSKVFCNEVSGSRSESEVVDVKDFPGNVWRGNNDSRRGTQAQAE